MIWEKPTNPFCIYALHCPLTNEIKYIGQTTTGIKRIYNHWKDFRLNKVGKLIKVKAWIKSLKNENIKFKISYLDYASNKEDLNQKEIYWINKYRQDGLELLNHSDGGHVYITQRYTDEQKLEISIRTKEAMKRPEVIENMNKARALRITPKKYKPRSEEIKKIHANTEYVKSKRIKIKDSNGVIYESLTACAKHLQTTKQSVWRVINKKQKTVKGLKLERC